MAEDATPLVEALLAIVDASRIYLPGGMSKDEFIDRVLREVDNPRLITALAAHGRSVGGSREPWRIRTRKTER